MTKSDVAVLSGILVVIIIGVFYLEYWYMQQMEILSAICQEKSGVLALDVHRTPICVLPVSK